MYNDAPVLIEMRHLRYFLAVAEELSFTRAAVRLNIAQPPLSQQIKQLETVLGFQLLTRSSRSVALTPAGAAFAAGARRVLATVAHAIDDGKRAANGEVERLRVGFTDSAALSVLPNVVRRFRLAHPSVYLELHEADTNAQLIALERDEVDVVLVRGPLHRRALEIEVVHREPFVAAVPTDHPFALKSRLSLCNLATYPLVLFPRRLAPEFYDAIMAMFRVAKCSPRIEYEVRDYQTMLSLVASGVATSIVPASVSNLARAGVAFLPLRHAQERAEIVLVYRKASAYPVLRAFVNVARGSKKSRTQHQRSHHSALRT